MGAMSAAALPSAAPAALLQPEASVRRYSGEHAAHHHDGHAQILYALEGRMELEVDGHAAFVDTASGMVVPPGARHAYLAAPHARMLVVDVPLGWGAGAAERMRRFQVPLAARVAPLDLAVDLRLALVLQAPTLLARRGLDAQAVERQVQAALHEDWPTARLAQLCHLSPQRFHTRWLELTGFTPQAWLRRLRLDRAEQALAQGRSLEATAWACGYRSASALAYALRRERQVGARALRAQGR